MTNTNLEDLNDVAVDPAEEGMDTTVEAVVTPVDPVTDEAVDPVTDEAVDPVTDEAVDPAEDMTGQFPYALLAVLHGEAVRRDSWPLDVVLMNCQGMKRPNKLVNNRIPQNTPLCQVNNNGNMKVWNPTQEDLLSQDWTIL